MRPTSRAGLARLAVVLGGAAAMLTAATAQAATSLHWSKPVLVDHRPPFSNFPAFTGVSCPSTSLCVAVEGADVAISTDPTGPGSTWRIAQVDTAQSGVGAAQLRAISCPSRTLCVAVDSAGDVLTSTAPTRGRARWRATRIDRHQVVAVSCPSVHLCVAVDLAGRVLTSRRPTGGKAAWHSHLIDRGIPSFTAVSCSSTHLCVALDRTGSIAFSRDPGAAHPRWQFTRLSDPGAAAFGPALSVAGISCVGSQCVFASGLSIGVSIDPTGGTRAWQVKEVEPPPGFIDFTAVSCASRAQCVAVDDAGRVFASTNPAAGNGTWLQVAADPSSAANGGLLAVSCPATRLCLAADAKGNVLSSAAPAHGGSAWRLHDLAQGYNAIGELSCPSKALCVASDSAGNILTASNLGLPRAKWQIYHLGASFSISCVAVSLCVAYDGSGAVATSNDPAAGRSSWTFAHLPGFGPFSCASPDLCVGVGPNGEVAVSTDPAGGAASWRMFQADTATGFECGKYGDDTGCDPGLVNVSCPTVSFCAAADASAGDVAVSGDPAGGPAAWSTIRMDNPPAFGYITCPSAQLCLKYDDYSSSLVVSGDPLGG
ncbi:MAG TPA: hypothetical protein VKT31_03205, partial [Solirubrobacteraceae bacterium]|nr:hypothetical protein [Solirubrobacteraceae bacterium]